MCFFFYSRVALADPLVSRERPFCDERRRAGGEEEFENSKGFSQDTKTQTHRSNALLARCHKKKSSGETKKVVVAAAAARGTDENESARVC